MLTDSDVFEGVWEKYKQPLFGRWILTLTNLNPFFALRCLALLLAFVQSRSWVLLRYLVFLRKKSIRLDDDTHSDPLEHLSQGGAISDVLVLMKYHLSNMKISQTLGLRGLRGDVSVQADLPVLSPVLGSLHW